MGVSCARNRNRGSPPRRGFSEVELEGELELARIKSGGWLTGGAHAGARGGIAQYADVAHVEAVQEIEGFGDEVKIPALAQVEPARDAQIHLEEARTRKCIPSQIAGAAQSLRGGDAGDADGALVRQPEANPGDKGRRDPTRGNDR